ncbi:unnamed protein product [Staurois parvus]|uniref:Uncharacterized protein n=1 Tax=Staurois parvus TaxID=386267 RepID=A0ABN9EUH8_9NEOB|nr:unnamed protein product [Staurois parvus]
MSVKAPQANLQEEETVLLPHRPPPKVPGPRPVPLQRSGVKSESLLNPEQKTEQLKPPSEKNSPQVPPKLAHHAAASDGLIPLRPPPRVPPKPKPEPSVNLADQEKLSDLNMLSASVEKIEVSGISDPVLLQPGEILVVCMETHPTKQAETDVESTVSISTLEDRPKLDLNNVSISAALLTSRPEAQVDTACSADVSTNALISKKEHEVETADTSETLKMCPIPKPRTMLPSQIVKNKEGDKILSTTKNNCTSECNSFIPAVPPRRKKSAPAAFHLQVLQSNKSLLQVDVSSNSNNNNNHSEGCLIDIDMDLAETVSTKGDSNHFASHTKPLEPQRSWSSKELDVLDFDDKKLVQSSNDDMSSVQFTDNWLMGQDEEKSENTIFKSSCDSPW